MNLFANYRPRVNPSVVTLITRELAGNGQILAKVGQEVTPSDILGQSTVSAGFRSVNLSKELSVHPNEVKGLLQKPIGSSIFRGEVLALKPSFLGKKKPYLANVDGIINSLDEKTGNLRVSYLPERRRMLSAVFGVIQRVDEQKGIVVIKTLASEIIGILGAGKIREGSLSILGERGSVTNLSRIKPSLTDKIIVTGSFIYQDALRAAVSIDVKGIITGGIGVEDFKGMAGGSLQRARNATDVGVSLLVAEGFGSVPIGEDIFQILLKHNDKFAVLDGNRGRLFLPSFEKDSMIKVRATALPAAKEEQLVKRIIEPEVESLSIGQTLRVITNPFVGEQGKLVSIDTTPTLLPSGMVTYLLTIETKRKKIKVPLPNIEII